MSAQPAARVDDKVAHTMALPGALTGLLVGAAIGVAIVATGGLGAIAVGAAIATTGGLGLAGEYIGESMPGPPSGKIVLGSSTIYINDKPAARATLSTALCREGPPQQEATGAATVFFDGMPAGRKGESLTCSAKIIEGSSNVFIGGPSVQTLPMDPEVPAWLHNSMFAMMIGGTILATGGIAATYGLGAAVGSLVGGVGGGYLGGQGARWAAEKMGFGETGQRIAEVLGGIGGGALGGGLGFRGGAKIAPKAPAAPKPVVTAEGTVGGKTFKDVNQTARVGGDPSKPTLISDRVAGKVAKDGKARPNGKMGDAHAEVGSIQQAFEAGVTKGADMKMTVTGEPVCGYCRGDVAAMAKASGLKSLTVYEQATGKTLYWEQGMKSLKVLGE
jgi:uncharacterized Zn-binding protein involved in type VI secretion